MTDAIKAALAKLPAAQLAMLRDRVNAGLRDHEAHRLFYRLFPDTGVLRRELYEKHLSFFDAGRDHMERALIGANRSGKTFTAAYELVAHCLGEYPTWWTGKRFDLPVIAWVSGVDSKSIRKTLQVTLFGEKGKRGTGMFPAASIMSTTQRSGVPGAIDTAMIRHRSGGASRVVIKSYDQGRESYQSGKIQIAWADEEPPARIYSEVLTRLMSTTPGAVGHHDGDVYAAPGPDGRYDRLPSGRQAFGRAEREVVGDHWLAGRATPQRGG
jgi:Terminase large subunit, T4likevirus-type, N-terminal